MNCRASAGIIVAWTLEQKPGDVFNAGGLLSAGEHFSNSGTDGPGAYSFARSVALCGAGRMGQVDGDWIASPKCAPCVKRLPNSALSKASLNAGATLWQSNGWRRNPNAPGFFTPMGMCGFIMENSPIYLGVILPENGSVCAARRNIGCMPWTAGLSLWSAAPSIPDYWVCCASRVCHGAKPMCQTSPLKSN